MKSYVLAVSLFILLAGFAAPSLAQDSMETRFERKLGHLFEFTQGTIASQPVTDVAIAGETEPSAPCAQTYNDFYSKPVTKFNVTLGYVDNFGTVQDLAAYTAWVEKLKRPCTEETGPTCGFANSDPTDASVFTKRVKLPNGSMTTVQLSMVNSSVSIDDQQNRSTDQRKQTSQTTAAQRNFDEGLRGSDLSIYVGHGRVCSGPSFEPSELLRDGISTNYGFYRRLADGAKRREAKTALTCQSLPIANETSGERMNRTLRCEANPPKLIGYFACDHDCNSGQKLTAATGGRSGVATSNGLTDADVAYAQAYAMLDSTLGMRCEREFKNALAGVVKYSGDVLNQPATMDGFFPKAVPVSRENPRASANFRTGGTILDAPPIRPAGPTEAGKTPKANSPAKAAK